MPNYNKKFSKMAGEIIEKFAEHILFLLTGWYNRNRLTSKKCRGNIERVWG